MGVKIKGHNFSESTNAVAYTGPQENYEQPVDNTSTNAVEFDDKPQKYVGVPMTRDAVVRFDVVTPVEVKPGELHEYSKEVNPTAKDPNEPELHSPIAKVVSPPKISTPRNQTEATTKSPAKRSG